MDAQKIWQKTKEVLNYVRLLIEALVPASISTAIFYFILFKNGIYWKFIEDDVFASAVLYAFLFPLYFLIASNAFREANTEFKRLMAAVKENGKHSEIKFRREYGKRIQPATDIILGLIAFSIIGIMMGLKYKNPMTGIMVIFMLSYVMYIMRQFSMGLDNPAKSILYRHKIPKEWLEKMEKEEQEEENQKNT